MEQRQIAIVIYDNGIVEITGPVTVGAIQIAVQRLQQAIASVQVAPSPPPMPNNIQKQAGVPETDEE